jgi:hypothetical protein
MNYLPYLNHVELCMYLVGFFHDIFSLEFSYIDFLFEF